MKGGDRNKPCWCGSGKKYKKCHLVSDFQENENYIDIDNLKKAEEFVNVIKTHIDAYEQEKCCAKDIGLGDCNGKIREACPVFRNLDLNEISSSGKIMKYVFDTAVKKNEDEDEDGKLLLKAKEDDAESVSVFYGFCEKHDRNLFSCFENSDFTGRSDQCLAIACQNISRGLHCRNEGLLFRNIYYEINKIISPENQPSSDSITDDFILSYEEERKNVENMNNYFFRAMMKKEYEILQSLIIKFDVILPYVITDFWPAYIDIYNHKLQDVLATRPERIFMSSFTDKNCSYICMSWLDTDDAPGKVIAEQIKNLSSDKQPEIILLMILMNSINIIFNPDWFEALNSDQRKLLDESASCRLEKTDTIPSPPVNSNIKLDLPKVERVFYSHNRS